MKRKGAFNRRHTKGAKIGTFNRRHKKGVLRKPFRKKRRGR